jgi:hypothetical protein
MTITQPGIYTISHSEYLADPVEGGSISSSVAKKLTPPRAPAKYWWEKNHPTAASAEMDLGTVAHELLLGGGGEIRVVDAVDWRSTAARLERDEARQAGETPILAKDYAHAKNMIAALSEAHPEFYGSLDTALLEKTWVWRDHQGVWCRAKIDYYHPGTNTIIDYKTTSNAALDSVERTIASFQYYQQAAWYVDAVANLSPLPVTPDFVFLFQETMPPYLSTMVSLVPSALEWGSELNRAAIGVWRECSATGVWPGYPATQIAALPGWVTHRVREMQEQGII